MGSVSCNVGLRPIWLSHAHSHAKAETRPPLTSAVAPRAAPPPSCFAASPFAGGVHPILKLWEFFFIIKALGIAWAVLSSLMMIRCVLFWVTSSWGCFRAVGLGLVRLVGLLARRAPLARDPESGPDRKEAALPSVTSVTPQLWSRFPPSPFERTSSEVGSDSARRCGFLVPPRCLLSVFDPGCLDWLPMLIWRGNRGGGRGY